MTDITRWLRLSQLFDRAIDLDAISRARFIDAECDGEPELRAALQKMLDADASASDIDMGARGMADFSELPSRDEEDDPFEAIRVGPWHLQALLGRGGMGTVYAAVRDDDSAHHAAVKRLHRRWDGSAQAQRFLQERRILASLSHRNLPRLIDHGLDGEGRPWFALEYVEGGTLIEWADEHRLDLRARVDLFRQVCAAVQHAHEHFVVHRDLKPANILVDNEGHPKVLDFGVAKRMDDAAGTTRTGAFAGFTPEYAAPEQISGGVISAATDVYALGVILYQLLTGQLPYLVDHDNLRNAAEAITSRTAARMDKALVTGEPGQVSARVAHRKTSVPAFRRFVRGDLTRIVQTALAKEPGRRYASVMAFSNDLKRLLEGRTVSVGGDTLGYRTRKFIGRNKWSVAMATLAVVAMTAGFAGVLFQSKEARAQAARAVAETRRAELAAADAKQEVERTAATNEFLRSVFSSANPVNSGTTNITLEQALDTALAQMEEPGQEQPQAYVRMLLAAADSYEAFDRMDKALAAVRRARDIQEKRLPDSKEDRGRVLSSLAWLRRAAEPAQSMAWAKEAVRLTVASRPPGDTSIREAYSVLAGAQYENGDVAGALDSTRAMRRSLLDGGVREDNVDIITLSANEGFLLTELKRYDEAVPIQRKVVAMRSTTMPADSVEVLMNRLLLADTLRKAGRTSEALTEFHAALPSLEKQLGPEHPTSRKFSPRYAQLLLALGRTQDALPALKRAYEYGRALADDTSWPVNAYWYVHALAVAGRCDEAASVIAVVHSRKLELSDADGARDPLVKTACAKGAPVLQ